MGLPSNAKRGKWDVGHGYIQHLILTYLACWFELCELCCYHQDLQTPCFVCINASVRCNKGARQQSFAVLAWGIDNLPDSFSSVC